MVMLLVFVSANAYAVLAKRKPRTLYQPDGVSFTGRVFGDENYHFAEYDGFTIVQNNEGWWTYANNKDGLLIPTTNIVGKSVCPFAKHIRPNAAAIAAMPSNKNKMINAKLDTRHKLSLDALYGPGGTKSSPKYPTGKRYCTVLMGDFTDSTFAMFSSKQTLDPALPNFNPWHPFPPSIYRHLLWLVLGDADSAKPVVYDSSTVGSFTNYYWDMSYQKFYWASDYSSPSAVNGVDTIRQSGMTWSAANQSDNYPTTYVSTCITNADPYVDFDQNNDGVQDGLIIVHPGPGEEWSGRTGDIWSMSNSAALNYTADGVSGLVDFAVLCPQNGMLDVFAHEMFHQIGGPDLYDYGIYASGWEEWSIMASGSAFAGGHLQYDIDGVLTNGADGWLNDIGYCDSISSLYRGDGQYTVASLDSAGEARRGNITSGIRLWRIRNKNFMDSSQVWFVENRQRTSPYESLLPESGILITHIDTRMGDGGRFNDGPPCERAYYSWVETPGFDPNPIYALGDTLNYDRNYAIGAYSADDFSMAGYNQTTLDSTTTPNSWINKCTSTTPARTGPFIFNVSSEGPYMSFNVLRTGMAATAPMISCVYHTVIDPSPSNNNAILDPWETDSLKVTVLNSATAITAGAQCSLYAVVNQEYVTITPGWKALGTGAIATNGQATSAAFVVAVSKDAPRFSNITFAAKITSTSPAYNDTIYFNSQISALKVVKTYDFSSLYVGGTTWPYRICPSDMALYGDTMFITNANLDNVTIQSRIYKVKKSTTNNPLTSADTFGSLNNKVTTNTTNYGGGMDIDPATNTLWWTIEDTVYHSNRGTTLLSKFEGPNTDWAGSDGYMNRIRGLAFGPGVVDTVGASKIINGDSLLVYWQQLNTTSNDYNTDSLFNLRKVASGTSTIARRWAFYDSGWPGASDFGWGWNAWNGRGIENDGQSIWTSVIDDNMMMRRDPDGKIIEMFPGPSAALGYGVYGCGIEHTNAAGTTYAPDGGAGSPAFVPYAKGTKTYLYCAAMGEGKIYKVDVTEYMIPTPPDSIRVEAVTATQNRVIIKKSNAPQQKIQKYIIYRRDDSLVVTDTDSIGYKNTGRVAGEVATVDTFYDNSAKSEKASHIYSVRSVNYSGYGDWGASVSSSLLGIELASFSYNVAGYSVQLNWATASELNSKNFEIQRSTDDVNYTTVGTVLASGNTSVGASYSYTDNVPSAGIYYYKLYQISTTGSGVLLHSGQVLVGKIPMRYELAKNYPNPLGRTATRINYAVKNAGHTSIKVYNVLGEVVKTLVNEKQEPGFYTKFWDATDDKGQQVSNGIYFYKMVSGDFASTQKMTVLK
jgi:M6 family metalloprotease-like protein